MVIFEFKIDETALVEDLETDPVAANEAVLQETFFEMPVRLSVNEVELLEIPGAQSPCRCPTACGGSRFGCSSGYVLLGCTSMFCYSSIRGNGLCCQRYDSAAGRAGLVYHFESHPRHGWATGPKRPTQS